ncbi:aldo/keto reductase [Nocardia wallacei]|uniref:aldo/keto reductase n=1 Tax=Nocardia wallacei TaxID=480035 RepID=UPI0024553A0D|nr:aldo/keto reductase [Nocardia wallacei]
MGDGYFGSQLTQSGLREVVEKAQSNGFTLWDTAAVYGTGHSETVLARALKGYARNEFQLSTKLEALADAADVDTRGSWEHDM